MSAVTRIDCHQAAVDALLGARTHQGASVVAVRDQEGQEDLGGIRDPSVVRSHLAEEHRMDLEDLVDHAEACP